MKPRILIVDDNAINRRLLGAILSIEGYDCIEVNDGPSALPELENAQGPLIAIVDWQMPGMTGLEVCSRARQMPGSKRSYLILLTVRDSKEDVVQGLSSGADDYITKPFNNEELVARVRTGARLMELQETLALRVQELEQALAQIKQLRGLLPICSYCKKIKDDKNYWQRVETYVSEHTDASFSHSICPHCFEQHVKPDLLRMGVSSEEIQQIELSCKQVG